MNYDEEKKTIKDFTDLNSWKEGHELVLEIYKATKLFPKNEQFSLTDQIQRAVVSITSNIAEGFSRTSAKEKVQFYRTALGSLTETQNQLLIARDVHYLNQQNFDRIFSQSIVVSKLLNGLIKKTKTFLNWYCLMFYPYHDS